MPHYYFHVRAPFGVVQDYEGAHFSGFEAARAEALVCVSELAAERLRSSNIGSLHAVEIADETGTILETLAVETILK
jgi:hypothetical protein